MNPYVVVFHRKKPPHGHGYHAGGLAANVYHTARVLGNQGFRVEERPVDGYSDVLWTMKKLQGWPTHVVFEAVWLTVGQVAELAGLYPKTTFVVRAHSKMGFLQVEPEAIPVVRGLITLRTTHPNVRFASNNLEFSRSLKEVYGDCLYLPNLYDVGSVGFRQDDGHTTLRIGSFGASRLLKLHPSAALASLQVAKRMGRDLELYINVDDTPGGASVRNSIANLLGGHPGAKLVQVEWQPPVAFRQTIANMDLVIQLSCTETFCMVAADAVSEGVPVVGGPPIAWVAGNHGTVPIDDTSTVATVCVHALERPVQTAKKQMKLLRTFVEQSMDVWTGFLQS